MTEKEDTTQNENKSEAANLLVSNVTTTSKVPEEPREISTREAYFAALNEWVKHANISQNAMAMFPWYFMSSYPQLFSQPASGNFMLPIGLQSPVVNAPTQNTQNTQPLPPMIANNLERGFGFRLMNDQAQAEVINRNGGYEYVVAPFWKRAVAELIDMIIMLFFKIVAIFIITNVFDYNLVDINKDLLNKALDDEEFTGVFLFYMDFLAFSSDLLVFEIATKLLVCLYEAGSTVFFNGASVGKHIMGLSIKYTEAMLILPNNAIPVQPGFQIQLGFQPIHVQMRALLFPVETPKFKRAFARALIKNTILSLLFPMFFLMIFFKNNRTVYDILTKTIVVETTNQPVVLRRFPQQQQQQQ